MFDELRSHLTALTPSAVLGRRRRRSAMPPLLQRLVADPAAALSDDAFLGELGAAWGNGGFPAHAEYLRGVAVAVRAARGNVLECGSGLSTIVLAAVAARAGVRVWSLEHLPAWCAEVNGALSRLGLGASAAVRHAPLRDYGGFAWYRPPAGLPRFALVVCDGPPRKTPGGRYGLVPVLRAHLAPGAVIILDDAARPGEQAVLRRWAAETGGAYEAYGRENPYAVFSLPGAP